MTVLAMEGISLEHGQFRLDVPGWQARAGELHALLGCNGAGKSTLLKVAAGEIPHRGRVMLHGRERQAWNAAERARHLAVLPQASQLSFGFTAAEVVGLGAIPLALGWRELQREVRRVMELAGCARLAEQAYPRLSGGEKQRVHFARVLLQLSQADRPPVLLLDEPTSAQDLRHQHGMLRRARALAAESGHAVVAVLHDLNHALRYADHCSLLDGGRLLREGKPDAVLTAECVKSVWGYPAQTAVDDSGRRLLV